MEEFLLKQADNKSVSFHMPGHKGSEIYRNYGHGEFLEKIMDCDITEIPGADNLFQAEGIIRETENRYAALYDVDDSFILVNGTSGGLIAAVMASVPRGGRLIMARNCHKSVFNALTLAGVTPVYAQPELISGYGISGRITSEEIAACIAGEPAAAAVILPSPNYYGICSDIRAIADICHRHGKILIVDQAHGAHLRFFHKYGFGEGLPEPAEQCGADITVNSIHKTLASFTQSSVLNLKSQFVDRYTLEDKLQAVQSTSPSYLLMASLAINASIIEKNGRELFHIWKESIDWFYNEMKKVSGVKVFDMPGMDRTKINLDAGLSGRRLENHLISRNIIPELVTGNIVMCMTGIGNTKQDIKKLFKAVETADTGNEASVTADAPAHGPVRDIPYEKTAVLLREAAGRVAGSSLTPYPPGIPFVCPGEEITAEAIAYLEKLMADGVRVVGIDDRGMIAVGK